MAALKSKGLWDTDEEDATVGLRNKAPVKTSLPVKSKPTLFDSDDGEDLFAPKLKTAPKVSKLFDEEDSDVHSSTTVDYRQLYESEVAKRKELEVMVGKLELEIASLRALLPNGEDEPAAPASETEWDAMAREEKLRRQRAIQQKASRHRSTAIKRSNGASATTVNSGSAEAPDRGPSPPNPVESGIGVSVVAAVPARAAQVGHYLDSDEGGDDTFPVAITAAAKLDIVSALIEETNHASARSVSLSPVNLSDDEEAVTTGGKGKDKSDKAADAPEDPEAAKWRELAAQEKARKALARRSVRVVRRGPSTAAGGAGGADGADGAAKPKHLLLSAHIKSSGSLQNLTTASSTAPLTSSASAPSIAPARVSPCPTLPQSESDWDSNSSSEEEGKAASPSITAASQTTHDAYARRPLPAVGNSNNNSTTASRSVSPVPSSSACSAGTSVGDITPEEEAGLERRLKSWAAGRSTAQLLCSVPSVAQFAAVALLESGEVTAAAQTLSAVMQDSNGHATAGDVRKAYMRVIRVCHPDKHMQLPPRGPAFLELQKIFTILSDSYNRYKAAQV